MENFCDRLQQMIDYYGSGRNATFAKKLGLSESNIRAWLGGTLPKLDAIERIAKYCEDVSLPWLILGEGTMIKGCEPAPPTPVQSHIIDVFQAQLAEKDRQIAQLLAIISNK